MDSKTPPKYDVDYFIAKFEAIPEEKWTTHDFVDGLRCCALGHCGVRETSGLGHNTEALALDMMLSSVVDINDGSSDCDYHQPTPKQRILAALRDVKEGRA